MATLTMRSTTPQSPSSLTPSMGSITPPYDNRLNFVEFGRPTNHPVRTHRLVPIDHPIHESRRSTPDIDDSSSDDSDAQPHHDPSSELFLDLSKDMTIATAEDPYIRHRPSPNAAPFIPSEHVPSPSGHSVGSGMPHNHNRNYNNPSRHSRFGPSLYPPSHGNAGAYHHRHSRSPSNAVRHQQFGYNVSPSNASPRNPSFKPQHQYGYNDVPNEADHPYRVMRDEPLPSPRRFDHPGAGAMHLRTPRHMRVSHGTPHSMSSESDRKTFHCLKLLENVQYCVYKLDSLQESYREEYARQQELLSNFQQIRAISPRDPVHAQLNSLAAASREKIAHLLMEISQLFSRLQSELYQRKLWRLTAEEESVFTKFQHYHDRFEQTQQHLVQAGLQHCSRRPALPAHASHANIQRIPVITANGTRGSGGGNTHRHGHGRGGSAPGYMSDGSNSRGNNSRSGRSTDPNALQATNEYPQGIADFGFVVIGGRMSQVISRIVPALAETEQQQKHICIHIQDLARELPEFADAKIVCLGSATNDLFIKGSDLNFCLRKMPLDIPVREAQVKMCQTLRNGNFDQVQAIIRQNGLPGVSFRHPQTALRCELSFNVRKEIGSSRLIRAYATIDSRFKHIVQVVKHWSIKRNVCRKGRANEMGGNRSKESVSSGTTTPGLSSYALVLMVINFLQQRRPPLLPILPIMVEPETGASPWSDHDDYQPNIVKYREFAAKNEESAALLLLAFFRFYAHEFDSRTLVVSVRTGSFLSKAEKNWNEDDQTHLLSVEDPFDSNHDLCENLDKSTAHFIVSEFMRAYRVLYDTLQIDQVCREYYAEKEIQQHMEHNDASLRTNSPPSVPLVNASPQPCQYPSHGF